MSTLSPARRAAVLIGRVVRERNAYTSEVANTFLNKATSLSAADRAFAMKLALGVTSTLGTLDEVINRSLRNPDDITPEVRDAMRVSTYEIIFLGKQNHAAVDQGVELVRSVAPKAAGLANAVLRKIGQSAESFPFGNPTINNQALSRQYAFPLWLGKRLMGDLGRDEAIEFMKASNTDAPIFIAENLCCDTQVDFDSLCEREVCKQDTDVEGCYTLLTSAALKESALADGLRGGGCVVSDKAAQLVAQFVLPKTFPESFLEIGCGRGTKTILLQSAALRKYGKQMSMTSIDDHQFKVDMVKKRSAACGVRVDEALVVDATKMKGAFEGRTFDAVFIDAPCSGVGTLRRHQEIRWKLTQKDVIMLAELGLNMLHEAAQYVAVGGELTFATCTVLKEENDQTVSRFLRSKVGEAFKVVDTITTTLTENGPDAHFAVKFVRTR